MQKQLKLGLLTTCTLLSISCDSSNSNDNNNSTTNTNENSTIPLPLDFQNVSAVNGSVAINQLPTTEDELTFQLEVFNSINNHRTTAGITPANLILDDSITALARNHNLHMAQQAQASRENGDNSILISHDNFRQRANTIFASGFNLVGENVAANKNFKRSEISNQFVTSWINSPGHRMNIEASFTHTGIDIYVDPEDNTVYATQLFARLP